MGDDEEEFDDSMRAEWAKTKARRDRWAEEYQLIQEEMKRTVVYSEWKAKWWRTQVAWRTVTDQALSQALCAYAERQADMWERLASSCIEMWVPLLEKNGADVLWAGQYQTGNGEIDEQDGEEEEEQENEGEDSLVEEIWDSYDLED